MEPGPVGRRAFYQPEPTARMEGFPRLISHLRSRLSFPGKKFACPWNLYALLRSDRMSSCNGAARR
jgi:hypothetical protein